MAIKIIDEYGSGKVGTPTANYPAGVPRNVTGPLVGDGLPFDQAWLKDVHGFFQYVMEQSGTVYSGVPDNALVSQYADAIGDTLIGLPYVVQDGLTQTFADEFTLEVKAGKIRNDADTRTLRLDTTMLKDCTVTGSDPTLTAEPWVVGNGNGAAFFDGYVPKHDEWYNVFLVNTPERVGDLVWMNALTPAAFFADGTVQAAGFTDDTLWRRIGFRNMALQADTENGAWTFHNPSPGLFLSRYAHSGSWFNTITTLPNGARSIVSDASGQTPPGVLIRWNVRLKPFGSYVAPVDVDAYFTMSDMPDVSGSLKWPKMEYDDGDTDQIVMGFDLPSANPPASNDLAVRGSFANQDMQVIPRIDSWFDDLSSAGHVYT